MIDKNKEAIKILEENKLTNIHTPEDKIRMEIDKQVDHTKVDDRGPLDLTRKIEETDKRIKELDNSLSIALEINDRYQRDCKKLNEQLDVKQKVLDRSNRDKENFFNKIAELSELNDRYQKENKKLMDKVREAEGETSIVKAVGLHSPEMRALEKENTDLKYDNKSLAKQVDDKVEEVKALKMKLELLDNKT